MHLVISTVHKFKAVYYIILIYSYIDPNLSSSHNVKNQSAPSRQHTFHVHTKQSGGSLIFSIGSNVFLHV